MGRKHGSAFLAWGDEPSSEVLPARVEGAFSVQAIGSRLKVHVAADISGVCRITPSRGARADGIHVPRLTAARPAALRPCLGSGDSLAAGRRDEGRDTCGTGRRPSGANATSDHITVLDLHIWSGRKHAGSARRTGLSRRLRRREHTGHDQDQGTDPFR